MLTCTVISVTIQGYIPFIVSATGKASIGLGGTVTQTTVCPGLGTAPTRHRARGGRYRSPRAPHPINWQNSENKTWEISYDCVVV